MEKHHKKLLRSNRPALVQTLELKYVFDGLVARDIFGPDDYEDFKVDKLSLLTFWSSKDDVDCHCAVDDLVNLFCSIF